MTIVIVGEGTSDSALQWPVRWIFEELDFSGELEIHISHRSLDKGAGLRGKIETAIKLFSPDVIFVHRDSDGESYDQRANEIATASDHFDSMKFVPLITVRMMEAWLLINESAIRIAAGNPKGNKPLNLPRIGKLETLTDPKTLLFDLLREASELTGRRLKKFSVYEARRIAAEEIQDFSPLLQLKAFQNLKKEIEAKIIG